MPTGSRENLVYVWVTTHGDTVLAAHSSEESAEKFLLKIVRLRRHGNDVLNLNEVNQTRVLLSS